MKRRIITPNVDFQLTQKKHNVDFFNCTINVLIERRDVNSGVSDKNKPKLITEVKK